MVIPIVTPTRYHIATMLHLHGGVQSVVQLCALPLPLGYVLCVCTPVWVPHQWMQTCHTSKGTLSIVTVMMTSSPKQLQNHPYGIAHAIAAQRC